MKNIKPHSQGMLAQSAVDFVLSVSNVVQHSVVKFVGVFIFLQFLLPNAKQNCNLNNRL